MTPLDPLRARLASIRTRRNETREQLESAARRLAAGVSEDEARVLWSRIDELRSELGSVRVDEIGRLESLAHPREFLPQLDGMVPILLMPLRLETRWEQGDGGLNLLVRVYPDDISVQSHDPALMPPELAAGKSFWNAPATSGDPNVRTKREIWRGMVSEFGLRRAAWIRQAANPAAPEPPQEAPERLTVPAAWTLPERLVFRFYGPNGLMTEVLGRPIPDGLPMSFDLTQPDLGFRPAGDDVEYPPEILWQVDFNTAVDLGMAVRLPLAEFGASRVERLIVLGVRASTGAAESGQLLERLIDDHRFTEGFSILKQGTPTNITNEGDKPAAADPDDVLKWLEGNGAFPTNPDSILYENESDGLRLARALGISPDSLRYIVGANNTDALEAIAMKRALWAGTLGYYIQQMLSPFFENARPDDPFHGQRMIAAARFFFTYFVFGRGPLPVIRVGDQPYGILPVTASSLKPAVRSSSPWPDAFLGEFFTALQNKMAILARVWIALTENVKRAGAGSGADDRLLSVLAQQASSVEFRSERLIGREYLSTYTAFKDKDKREAAIGEFDTLLQNRFNAFQFIFPGLFPSKPRIFDLSFFGGAWEITLEGLKTFNRNSGGTLLTGDIVDNLPFSESRPIASDYPNYIDLLATVSFEEVRAGFVRTKPGGSAEPVSALLYLLLRHSYLYEHALAAMRLHNRFRGVGWSEFREKELYNLAFTFDATYWRYLEDLLTWELPGPLGPRRASALDLIKNRRDLRDLSSAWFTLFGDVEEQSDALRLLAGLKTARLERLFAEHIDLASYRLDAWATGLAYQTLLGARVRGDAVPSSPERERGNVRFQFFEPFPYQTPGIFLGAYGWLENLHPDPPGTPVNDLPEELTTAGGRPVTRDPDNYGLIHAPSLNHAVTAALLRSGSVTQPDKPALNIDLSSARVRDALWLVEGVRQGQSPAALLGYRYERILAGIDVKLLGYLPQLRAAFPMPKPQETATGEPLESAAPLDVVNGMLLVQSLRSDFVARTAFAPAAQPQFTQAANRVADLFDAVGDLMLAECVHQAAQGNFERAGSVVTAAGEFTHVPSDFEVVETPRSGASLTHRVLFAINASAVGAPPPTPRARLEPDLNAWFGTLLPDLSTLAARVTYTFLADGEEDTSEHTVLASGLGIEPIDLLFATDSEESPEFAARIDAAARPSFEAANPGAQPLRVHVSFFPPAAAGVRPLGELLPLLDSLRSLLAQSRGAVLRDMVPASRLHGLNEENLEGVDRPDLIRRVFGVSAANPALRDENSLWFAFIAARDALVPDAAATVADWIGRLSAASLFGIPEAVPVLPAGSTETLESLAVQAARVHALMDDRAAQVGAKWQAPAVPAENVNELAGDVVRILLGGSFPLMPRIQPSAAIPPVFAAAAADHVEDWLFAAAQVREPVRRLQDARTLSSEFAAGLAALEVRQGPGSLPVWIADKLPVKSRNGELASFVVQPAGDSIDAGQPFGALVIDEWNEILPQDTETTGVAFHYDAPNSEPPQSLLLAVSDRRLDASNWSWDELAGCVEQALLLAKIRAVTPGQLRETPLDIVLPATYAAESSTPGTIALSWFANISPHIANMMVENFPRP
jgi:hypothetical protein